MEVVHEVDSARVCDVLLGKLDELMEFLSFGAVQPKKFHGIVTFFFNNSNGKSQQEEIVCIRTINMQHAAIEIFPFAVNAETVLANCRDYVPVQVNLADFLYMYSGEASAAEIAGMCMTGRVRVPWSQTSKLRAFADSFDFSTENWDAFYALKLAQGGKVPPVYKCCKSCCQEDDDQNIESNWLLVCEATLSPALIHDDEWQVVNDCKCQIVPNETREQMNHLFGPQQVDHWLATLCDQFTNKQTVQRHVSKTVNGIREFAGKLIQVFDE